MCVRVCQRVSLCVYVCCLLVAGYFCPREGTRRLCRLRHLHCPLLRHTQPVVVGGGGVVSNRRRGCESGVVVEREKGGGVSSRRVGIGNEWVYYST